MISLILTDSPLIRDSIISELQLTRDQHTEHVLATVYHRREWILLFGPIHTSTIEWATENFLPDRISIPFLGESLSPEHRIGDVILPNVFLTYDPTIEGVEITTENRDHLMGSAVFLEDYSEQGDYLDRDHGLSVGGILLQHAPEHLSDELQTHIALVYEPDVMIRESLTEMIDLSPSETIAPISILVGVTRGRLSDIPHGLSTESFTIHNIVETIKEMREEK